MKKFLPTGFGRKLLSVLGASRHGVLSARRNVRTLPVPFVTKAAALMTGSACIGTAVAFLVQAKLGLSSYDVLSSGIVRHLPVTMGQAGWMIAAAFFLIATLLRRPPSGWGIAFILGNGLAIDAANGLLNTPTGLLERSGYVTAGLVLMAIGVSLVLDSGATGGPFELIMKAGQDRGLNPTAVRYGLDIGVFVLGLSLGGSFGPATVVHAATFGLLLQTVGQAFTDRRVGRELRHQAKSAAPPVMPSESSSVTAASTQSDFACVYP